jgi:hypothetical protein
MKDKVLSSGIYCNRCDCLIKDKELAEWECGQCEPGLEHWENVDIVMKNKGKWSDQ